MKNKLFMLAFSIVSMKLIQESSAVKQLRKTRIYPSEYLKKKKDFNPLESIEKQIFNERKKSLPVKRRLCFDDVD